MPQIHRGTYRVTILIGPVALKFVRPVFVLNLIKGCLKVIGKKHFMARLENQFRQFRLRFARGVMANVSEWATYSTTKAEYLAPTYFTLGIVNISRRQDGDKLTLKEIDALIEQIPERERNLWYSIEPHSVWEGTSWRKTPKGYVLVDYGDLLVVEFLYL